MRTLSFFGTGAILGGHVRAVFTLITFIFTICVAFTVTSFTEIPLRLLERQANVSEDSQTVLMEWSLADILLTDWLLD
jgi:solute carrier family 45 protein 1/2/4